jgi:hypothetical protein
MPISLLSSVTDPEMSEPKTSHLPRNPFNDKECQEGLDLAARRFVGAGIGVRPAARAVAQWVQVAEHTLRRHRVHPHTQDDLAFPATLPSSDN